ncbi:hypothetical protein PYJP_03290 [Pyrofollis japonicus]|uniref:archaellin/type IV pilin N-terminal domain-containing protein n=1 Tax=Pyrofollis japonicus TaxID=3060460 RepID=UPI00295C2043|nr:archaellin/type IV pilin N-terminal domain-containing protein [Pyrofollis japonicus]BEP16977.1 hypothetical protein PYJP_03290 [Pyrofollis japonicus]
MRALSPILSAVILVMATIAAGVIVYQYFMSVVNSAASKPILYVSNAQYIDTIKKIFITIYNSGPKTITIDSAEIFCTNNNSKTVNISETINVDHSKTIIVDIGGDCVPSYIVLNYSDSTGRSYSSNPIRIS